MPANQRTDPLSSIDPVIHASARLKLVTQLYVVEEADVTFLSNATGLTWGNLSTHLRKLEDHEYIKANTEFRGRRPRTVISLTERGRTAFQRYRTTIQTALNDLPS
jgi:DNA-binding MarR family transcriptional regulator